MSDYIVRVNKDDYAGVVIKDDHNFLLATTPLTPRGLPKQQKRLARIKRNLFRELQAFNKEMRRFPSEDTYE
jgi:hypothetical protein